MKEKRNSNNELIITRRLVAKPFNFYQQLNYHKKKWTQDSKNRKGEDEEVKVEDKKNND